MPRMLRHGGKRIRMGEPPPEYDDEDEEPPMTPMTPASCVGETPAHQ